MLLFLLAFYVFVFAVGVLMLVSLGKIYSKAGWSFLAILFPIYNCFVFLHLIGKPRWWILPLNLWVPVYFIRHFNPDRPTWLSLLIMFLYLVQFIFSVWSMNILGKCFGKEEGFTLGLVTLTPVFLAILAFDGSPYIGPVGDWREHEAYNKEKMQAAFDFESERRGRRPIERI